MYLLFTAYVDEFVRCPNFFIQCYNYGRLQELVS